MGETEYKTSINTILGVVLSKLWIILIISVVVATISAAVTHYLISPVYSSTARFYVNNDATEVNDSITSQDISAAQSLVDTYIVMIKTDSVLEEVANDADVDYDPEELSDMMTAGSINGTEVFYITMSSTDKEEAFKIMQAVEKIVPEKISAFIKGSTVTVVDPPKLATEPDSPSLILNTIMGFMVGFVLSFAAFVIREITDNTVNCEEDIKGLFENYTVIGQIPTISLSTGGTQYGYGKKNVKPANYAAKAGKE